LYWLSIPVIYYLSLYSLNMIVSELKDEIKREEKTFNFLLIAVLSPILVGLVVIIVSLLN